MNRKVLIRTSKVTLRTLRIADVTAEYIRGLNDPEVNRFLVNVRLRRQTQKTIESFIRTNLTSKDSLLLGIFKTSDNVLVGTVRISDISDFHRLCSVGICIFDKSSWGKGYAVESIKSACAFVFDHLGLHYIEAGVFQENRASMRLFKNAGFNIQARFVDKYRYLDGFKPVVIWSKTNPGFNFRSL
jgi:RimJ/RimL family protein N-acetyltransferase